MSARRPAECVMYGPEKWDGRMVAVPCKDRRCFLAAVCAREDDDEAFQNVVVVPGSFVEKASDRRFSDEWVGNAFRSWLGSIADSGGTP